MWLLDRLGRHEQGRPGAIVEQRLYCWPGLSLVDTRATVGQVQALDARKRPLMQGRALDHRAADQRRQFIITMKPQVEERMALHREVFQQSAFTAATSAWM